jgi:hypothetical protein
MVDGKRENTRKQKNFHTRKYSTIYSIHSPNILCPHTTYTPPPPITTSQKKKKRRRGRTQEPPNTKHKTTTLS